MSAYSFRLRTHLGINDSNCGSKAAMNAVEAELCINPVVFAEVSVGFERIAHAAIEGWRC